MSSDNSIFDPDVFLKAPDLPSEQDSMFTDGGDWFFNACINWTQEKRALYYTGYKEAADRLVKSIENNGSGQDTLIYPIAFLYRHYIELILKDLIISGRKLYDIECKQPEGHNLASLWNTCQELLAKIAPDDSRDEIRAIRRLLNEISVIDPNGTTFRYPFNIEGNNNLEGQTRINIANIKTIVGKMSIIFEGASAMISEHLSIKSDMASYYCE